MRRPTSGGILVRSNAMRRGEVNERQGGRQLDDGSGGSREGHRGVPGRRGGGRAATADPDVPDQGSRPARGDGRDTGRGLRGLPAAAGAGQAVQQSRGQAAGLPDLLQRPAPAEDTLVENAALGGTVPLWEWIGDEPATTFSY